MSITPIVVHIAVAQSTVKLLLMGQMQALAELGYDVMAMSSGAHTATANTAIAGIHIPFTRRFSPLQDARTVVILTRRLRHIRPMIVHTHTVKGGLLGQLAAWFAGVPIRINTIHGLYHSCSAPGWQNQAGAWSEKVTARLAHKSLSQNREDLQFAHRTALAPPHRMAYLGNGIRLANFTKPVAAADIARVRAELGLVAGEVTLVCVGRKVREKGYLELAQAIEIARASVPIKALFIGPTESEKTDRIDADHPVVRRTAPFISWLDHRDDISLVLAASDIFALASHREGMPRAVMEASARGLPCIVTDVRGCREVVEHQRTGLLVARSGGITDIKALAAAIVQLASDATLRRCYGQAAARKAAVEFDEGLVVSRIARCYQSELALRGLR